MGTGSSKKLQVLSNLVQSMTSSTKTLQIVNDNFEQTIKYFELKKDQSIIIQKEQNEITMRLNKQKDYFAQFISKFQPFLINFQQQIAIINDNYDVMTAQNKGDQLMDQRDLDQKQVEFGYLKNQFQIETQKIENQKLLFATFKYNEKNTDQAKLLQQYNALTCQIKLLEEAIKLNFEKIEEFQRNLKIFEDQCSQKFAQNKTLLQIEKKIFKLCSNILNESFKKLTKLEEKFDQTAEQQIQQSLSLNQNIEDKKTQLYNLIIKNEKLQITLNSETKNIPPQLMPQFQAQIIDLNLKLRQISSKQQLKTIKPTRQISVSRNMQEQVKNIEEIFWKQCAFNEELISQFKIVNDETIRLKNKNKCYQVYFEIKKLETQFKIKVSQTDNEFQKLIKKEEEFDMISLQEISISDQIQNFEIQMNTVLQLVATTSQKYLIDQEKKEKQILEQKADTLHLELVQLNQKYIDKKNEVASLQKEKEKYQQCLEELKYDLDRYKSQIIDKEENEELKYKHNLDKIRDQQENMINLKKKVQILEEQVTEFQKTLMSSILKNNEIQKIIKQFKTYIENFMLNSNTIKSYDKNEFQKIYSDLEILYQKFEANSEIINQLQATIDSQQNEMNNQTDKIAQLQFELQIKSQKLEDVIQLSYRQKELIETQKIEIEKNEQKILDLEERNFEGVKNKDKLLTDFEKVRDSLNRQIEKLKQEQEIVWKELKIFRENDKDINRNQKQRLCELQEKLLKLKDELEKANQLANEQNIQSTKEQLIDQAKQNLLINQFYSQYKYTQSNVTIIS